MEREELVCGPHSDSDNASDGNARLIDPREALSDVSSVLKASTSATDIMGMPIVSSPAANLSFVRRCGAICEKEAPDARLRRALEGVREDSELIVDHGVTSDILDATSTVNDSTDALPNNAFTLADASTRSACARAVAHHAVRTNASREDAFQPARPAIGGRPPRTRPPPRLALRAPAPHAQPPLLVFWEYT